MIFPHCNHRNGFVYMFPWCVAFSKPKTYLKLKVRFSLFVNYLKYTICHRQMHSAAIAAHQDQQKLLAIANSQPNLILTFFHHNCMTDTFWQFYLLNEKKSLLYVYLILEWGMYNDLTKQNVFGETCVFGNSWPAP